MTGLDVELQKVKGEVASVKQSQNAHEVICAERYNRIGSSIIDLEDTVKLIFSRLWKTAIGIVFILLSIIGYQYAAIDSHQEQELHQNGN